MKTDSNLQHLFPLLWRGGREGGKVGEEIGVGTRRENMRQVQIFLGVVLLVLRRGCDAISQNIVMNSVTHSGGNPQPTQLNGGRAGKEAVAVGVWLDLHVDEQVQMVASHQLGQVSRR